jgi:hypothetical protein
MNELARNFIRATASCLAGIVYEDVARGATATEVDVQLLVKVSFGCSSTMTGFMPHMSTVYQSSLEDLRPSVLRSSKIPLPDPWVHIVAT